MADHPSSTATREPHSAECEFAVKGDISCTPAATLEPLHTLRELSDKGYGSRRLLMQRIKAGTLPVYLVGNRYVVRDSDLHLLRTPVTPASAQDEASA